MFKGSAGCMQLSSDRARNVCVYPQNVCLDHARLCDPSTTEATVLLQVIFMQVSLRDDPVMMMQVI